VVFGTPGRVGETPREFPAERGFTSVDAPPGTSSVYGVLFGNALDGVFYFQVASLLVARTCLDRLWPSLALLYGAGAQMRLSINPQCSTCPRKLLRPVNVVAL
jgi:hypothetical protein